MRARTLSTFVLAAMAAVMATNCGSDATVAPRTATPAPSSASHTLLSSPETVIPITRDTPLAAPITVTKTIGVLGGTITVPGTGLSVVVPPLAVGRNTQFSVTALAGSAVAYDFQPHGTRFLVPLIATQDLHNTHGASLLGLGLFAAYFPDSSNPTQVTETFSVQLNVLSLTAVYTIPHFSGYILAGGRAGDDF